MVQLNFTYHYYVIGAFASLYTRHQVCYEGSSILQIDTYCSVSFHFFLLHSSLTLWRTVYSYLAGVQHKQECRGRQQNSTQLAISFQIDTTQSPKIFHFGIKQGLVVKRKQNCEEMPWIDKNLLVVSRGKCTNGIKRENST